MPREIVNKNIAGANVKCLSMTADQIGRTLRIGNRWNILHIGVLIGVQGTGGTVTTPTLAIGVCSGTAQMFGSFAGFTRNFFGVRTSGNLAFNGGSPSSYQSGAFSACRKVGNTITDGSTTATLFGDATANLLTFIGIRVAKSGANILIQAVTCQNTTSTQNRSFTDWLMALETRTLTSLWGNYVVSGTLGTFAYDEATNGTLDTLYITWNQATVPLIIKDFGASVRR